MLLRRSSGVARRALRPDLSGERLPKSGFRFQQRRRERQPGYLCREVIPEPRGDNACAAGRWEALRKRKSEAAI
jgi:hypothetical protein